MPLSPPPTLPLDPTMVTSLQVLVHLRRLCRRCGFERPSRQPFHTTQTTQVWTADDARPPLLVAPPPPADDRDTRNGGVAHDLEMHDLEPHDLETTEPAAHARRSTSGTDADRAPSTAHAPTNGGYVPVASNVTAPVIRDLQPV